MSSEFGRGKKQPPKLNTSSLLRQRLILSEPVPTIVGGLAVACVDWAQRWLSIRACIPEL